MIKSNDLIICEFHNYLKIYSSFSNVRLFLLFSRSFSPVSTLFSSPAMFPWVIPLTLTLSLLLNSTCRPSPGPYYLWTLGIIFKLETISKISLSLTAAWCKFNKRKTSLVVLVLSEMEQFIWSGNYPIIPGNPKKAHTRRLAANSVWVSFFATSMQEFLPDSIPAF